MQNEMADDFVDDESRKILKEVSKAVLLYCHSISLKGLRKTIRNLTIAGLLINLLAPEFYL
jgi:hypothetical protein